MEPRLQARRNVAAHLDCCTKAVFKELPGRPRWRSNSRNRLRPNGAGRVSAPKCSRRHPSLRVRSMRRMSGWGGADARSENFPCASFAPRYTFAPHAKARVVELADTYV